MTLDDLIQRVNSLNPSQLVVQAAALREEELADLNVANLEKGIRSDGSKITPEYSPSYAAFKGFKTPNLKLEGDFHSGIFFDADKTTEVIKTGSTDWKEDKLREKYGNEILGVSDSQLMGEIDDELPELIDKALMG